MADDLATPAAEMTPYVSPAVGAYGGAVLVMPRTRHSAWGGTCCSGSLGPGERRSRCPTRQTTWPLARRISVR
jgi:hypothetical protein